MIKNVDLVFRLIVYIIEEHNCRQLSKVFDLWIVKRVSLLEP